MDLAGRRVAVVGTGASAIQFVPEIARTAARVDVYQRTAALRPAQARPAVRRGRAGLLDRLPALRKAERLRTFLLRRAAHHRLRAVAQVPGRAHADVAPPARARRSPTRSCARKCVPGYVMGCKRVLFSNDWYPTLARPNVELVTDPIERIAADGVVTAGGTTRPADVIVYGTGFQTLDFLAPMAVTGLRRAPLRERGTTGPQAYLGITVAGFPNFFMLYGPNTNLGGNSILYMLEGQIRYVLGAAAGPGAGGPGLARRAARGAARVQRLGGPRPATPRCGRAAARAGTPRPTGRNTNNWPDHTFLYRHRIRHFDLGQVPGHAPPPGRVRGLPRARHEAPAELRLPPPAARLERAAARAASVLSPALPWEVQRRRLDRVMGSSPLPRGTTRRAGHAQRGARRGGDRPRGPPRRHRRALPRRRLLRRLGAHRAVLGRAPERARAVPGGAARVPAGARARPSRRARRRPRGAGRAAGPGRHPG